MAIRENQRANYEQGLEIPSAARRGRLMILGRPSLLWDNAPTPEDFYKGLGFDEVHTMDVSPYQGASHIHDLNKPLPAELAGQYDAVLSGGTLEHVFDIANALRCVAAMVKVGGTVICDAPMNNWIDHGFYQLSPTLKFDFFGANEFELRESRAMLIEPMEEVRRVFPLYPGEGHPWNGTRCKLTHSLAAIRLPESTVDRVPTQGLYLDVHDGQKRKFRFRAIEPQEMQGGAIMLPPMERFTLEEFRPLDGRWAAPLHVAKHLPSVDRLPFRSKALVYEDGTLLQWIVSDPAMVKERPGSFYHAARFVHFSTSDGSDPRSNGKRYQVAFPDLSDWTRR